MKGNKKMTEEKAIIVTVDFDTKGFEQSIHNLINVIKTGFASIAQIIETAISMKEADNEIISLTDTLSGATQQLNTATNFIRAFSAGMTGLGTIVKSTTTAMNIFNTAAAATNVVGAIIAGIGLAIQGVSAIISTFADDTKNDFNKASEYAIKETLK